MKAIPLNHFCSGAARCFGSPNLWGAGLRRGIPAVLFLLNIVFLLGSGTEAFALEPVPMGQSVTDMLMKMGSGKTIAPRAPGNPRPPAREKAKPSAKRAHWTNEAKAAPKPKLSQGRPVRPQPGTTVPQRAKSPGLTHATTGLRPAGAVSNTTRPYVSIKSLRSPVRVLKKASLSGTARSPVGIRSPRPVVNPAKGSIAKGSRSTPTATSRSARLRPALKKSARASDPRLSIEPVLSGRTVRKAGPGPRVKAKAMLCVDCSSNKVVLAKNEDEPLPIASITKLLTAMIVIDRMNLDTVLKVPWDIKQVPRHKVGIRPGELFTAQDLLHGMLIESGNDCAEVLARAYPKGGRYAFMSEMNKLAARLGASHTRLYTPSGLDKTLTLGRKGGRDLEVVRSNVATAEDVAVIARHAFKYPLIRQIAGMKSYTMHTRNAKPRNYRLATNDKLLYGKLPVAGAKTGYTNLAGRCIVALFKNENREHVVVVLNTPKHFRAAEKIYRWACKSL